MTAQAISGVVVAFVKEWQVAVVMLAAIPLMGIVGASMGCYYSKPTQKAQVSYADAVSFAEQIFGGIRTIYSFSLQDQFAKRYDANLETACVTGSRRGLMLGIQIGIFMFNLFCTYGLTFCTCGATHRIFGAIEHIPDIDLGAPGGVKDKSLSGQVEFRNVNFAYPTRPGVQVLKNFSVSIEPGMTVALVGSSSSGKSTSVQLLQRFSDTLAGDI
ncbi:ABC transporter transmembrane region-domain-containing protein [Fennellomyces sp. T-0311]|nr:ABC transporter transmembrane region-domain-containing protein [Fennellomyces sp. T-0311]